MKEKENMECKFLINKAESPPFGVASGYAERKTKCLYTKNNN